MEEILLSHFYLLSKRKSFGGTSLTEFWDMDCFQMYSLLDWEHDLIEEEEAERERNKQGKPEAKPLVEDDPQMTSLADRLMNRDPED